MTTNTPSPALGATAKHTLLIAEDRSRSLNPGEAQKFSTTLDGQPVVTRSAVPMYDSCRVLQTWGYCGKVEFVRADGVIGMTMSIADGAKLTVQEGPSGPKVRKYRAMDRGGEPMGGSNTPEATQVAIAGLETVIRDIDAMSDADRALFDEVLA
ncbi:hypothetical protein [Devosia sp.]|uniref:hypothetical protein n=1 Tax=Devosia sp. TaxID=1871048 RepID=UPI0032652395